MRAVVTGYGKYLPENIVTNKKLEETLDTNDQWIRERTGIIERHIAAEGEYTSHLASKAGAQALQTAGISPEDVDMIILATATPDETFPSSSTRVQHALGCKNACAMDLQAACSGFVYSMAVADGFIRSGQKKTILVIGAETMSRVVNWQDRGTCILFGDGAGAVLVQAQDAKDEQGRERGILSSHLAADGAYADILKTDGGVSSTQKSGVLSMEGQEVFRHAVSKMSTSAAQSLENLGLTIADIDWLVPHQANARILTACAKKLNIPEEKIIMNVAHSANTSSASIPLALAQACLDGKIKNGDLVVCPALGAGLTWGTCIIRW